jgi:hypothetical protein
MYNNSKSKKEFVYRINFRILQIYIWEKKLSYNCKYIQTVIIGQKIIKIPRESG